MANKRNISFMDPSWLQDLRARNVPLSRENILEYFSLSPFYDLQSNNQAIRAQGVSAIHLKNMKGLEFEVEPNQDEPQLFVIKKQKRSSPNFADILEKAFQVALDDVHYTTAGRTCLEHPSVLERRMLHGQRQIPELPSFSAIVEDIEAMTAGNL